VFINIVVCNNRFTVENNSLEMLHAKKMYTWYSVVNRRGGGILLPGRRLYITDMFMRKTNLMYIKMLRHGANIRCLEGNKNDIFFLYKHEKK